jgi:3-oxo-5-alpha-steroid 4-dehydrogenase 3
LYESLFVTKAGSSPMFVLHWVLGLIYYTCNLMSVWVEGSGKLRRVTASYRH